MVQEMSSEQNWLLDVASRVRTTEGQYNLLRDRVLIVNNNMIMQYKKTNSEMNELNKDLKELKEEIFKLKEAIRHLLSDVELFAHKDQVTVLEKYINLWSPMKFVTETEVIRLIEKHSKKEVNESGRISKN